MFPVSRIFPITSSFLDGEDVPIPAGVPPKLVAKAMLTETIPMPRNIIRYATRGISTCLLVIYMIYNVRKISESYKKSTKLKYPYLNRKTC